MIHQQSSFTNAQQAFVMLYNFIQTNGIEVGNGTKAINNIGFYLENPLENTINVEWRRWSKKYAEREWQWYLSENRSVSELKKYAPIWDQMHTGDDIVNSNYGYLWSESDQLKNVLTQLRTDKNTRQAWLTLFDGKRKSEYVRDTPCTLGLGFTILDGKLNMNVQMRSNDLWFGFCNDQYAFSKLQKVVADELKIRVGTYYHFAANLHLYERHYDSLSNFYSKRNK